MLSMREVGVGVFAAVLLYGGPAALASVDTNNNCLPPENANAGYVGSFSTQYSNGVIFANPVVSAFTACSIPPLFGTNGESFGATVDFDLSLDGTNFTHYTANANVFVFDSFNHTSGNQSFYDTQVTQFDVSGGDLPANEEVRESPTLSSTGQTVVTDLGGGSYRIDSFFDVFTEISLDGGLNWSPSTTGSGHLDLEPIPEPGDLALLAAAFGGLAVVRRRAPR